MTLGPLIWVAIPLLNETYNLPKLLSSLKKQSYQNFKVIVCVNQPDCWWDIQDKRELCEDNQKSIQLLQDEKELSISIIDKSSQGNGWTGKEGGVPWARKLLFDTIMESASILDFVISLDGDTDFSEKYFESILENFSNHKNAVALSIPYYHKLMGNVQSDLAILRYEIYMRYYHINMIRIKSVYQFAALGSAIAFPAWSYKKIKGIKPKPSGEDFYLLQKFRKFGPILNYNVEKVFPSSRPSDRVLFGTGPAVINGMKGEWERYPIYSMKLYDDIESACQMFNEYKIISTPNKVTDFFHEKLKESDQWEKIKSSSSSEERFVRACHEKFDGLRILQYLKFSKDKLKNNDTDNLNQFFLRHYPDSKIISDKIELDVNNLESLNIIRDELFAIENHLLHEQWTNWNHKQKW
ncbi:MAG: hypothetical protein COA79_00610 [Planctomycetota bacterium]|nr:MAG: hypothetical protein COA79_00610 [Planctomycetota bacterium]